VDGLEIRLEVRGRALLDLGRIVIQPVAADIAEVLGRRVVEAAARAFVHHPAAALRALEVLARAALAAFLAADVGMELVALCAHWPYLLLGAPSLKV